MPSSHTYNSVVFHYYLSYLNIGFHDIVFLRRLVEMQRISEKSYSDALQYGVLK